MKGKMVSVPWLLVMVMVFAHLAGVLVGRMTTPVERYQFIMAPDRSSAVILERVTKDLSRVTVFAAEPNMIDFWSGETPAKKYAYLDLDGVTRIRNVRTTRSGGKNPVMTVAFEKQDYGGRWRQASVPIGIGVWSVHGVGSTPETSRYSD